MSKEVIANTLQGFDSGGTITGASIDEALYINLIVSIVLFASVVLPMIYFAWKYRESNVKNEDIKNVTHNTLMEILWTAIPTAMLFVLFYYGYSSMTVARDLPNADQSITVKVEGSKWKWRYEYPANANGFVHKLGGAFTKPKQDDKGNVLEKGTMGKSALYVPVNTNIILEMSAPIDDVLHAFYVPAFRIKEDVVPGRVTKQWFKAENIGEYDVECAEYCGTDHSYMYSRVVVLPEAEYNAWFNSSDDTPKGDYGKSGDAVLQQHGCKSCHAVGTDKQLIGPTLNTRRLTTEQVLDVINNGQDKLGYAMGAMPAGMATGTDAQEIAAYVASGMKGDQPASFAACSSCHGEDGKGMYGMSPNLVEYDADLLRNVLKNGKEGMMGTMPAFPYVSEEEISAIAEYLNSTK
ncbi:cytochrome c oxidase subunit II [Sulfurimonas aquatica]|uniref:Cytochrome c oxidase subunit 2 n=1 Tax=Sulfurimonas aquatica TaxID=2672570 RepID=A0A975B232_9BACT|nr:cytochrome c oxidase subunit II [Sulfurimonas aquatica]QSZ42811.1 cytochrome c oxidase subunit II [Sulfurimonas aquatica]